MQPNYSSLGARKMYGNFQGFDSKGDPTMDPVTGRFTAFMNNGDPITNTGWLDHYYTDPCDVYFMQGCGTFSIASLDTQRVIYAVIVGQGEDHLSSIVDLRRNTHFVRSSFYAELAVKATAETEINYISEIQTGLIVNAPISSERGVSSVQAGLYDYNDSLIYRFDLFDDGVHGDGVANDNIYGNIWQTAAMDNPLYLNLRLTDGNFDEHIFRHAVDKIMLSNRIAVTSFKIVDDNINDNLKINPGENVRINFGFTNNYAIDFDRLNVTIQSDDPLVQVESKVLGFDKVISGATIELNYEPDVDTSFFALDISPAIADTHTVPLNLIIFDNQYRRWLHRFTVRVEPFDYVPNEIIPTHIAGKSDASFRILVIDPSALTGHSYLITISDSINEERDRGFNLIDQTMGNTILSNHPAPDEFAYNMPITDGFKIIKAVLPEGGLQDVSYENISGGNPTGFKGVSFGGKFFNGGILLGAAPDKDFFKVELEFTNAIDSSGVNGEAMGQYAFRYELGKPEGPTGFFRCPFNVWKIIHGERAGRLNVCFLELTFFSTFDNVWAPDASDHGGMETLYIMATDYDETGQFYLNRRIEPQETLYKIYLKLQSESSVVDAGDKMIFDWEYPATSEDVFTFIPTNVKEGNIDKPSSFALYQNYPNPFNAITTIRFSIDKPGPVKLKIINVMGQEVIELVGENIKPGIHSIRWEGQDSSGQMVSSGLYFAVLKNSSGVKFTKLLLIR